MPENVRTCPLCGSDRSRLFDRREFRGHSVINRLCQKCGLVYQSPRMTGSEAEVFYAEEYRHLYEGSTTPTARNLADQQGRAESLYSFAHPVVGSVAHHLDIGCSFGLLLQRFQEAYHCQAIGIEPGESHCAHARKEGLTVFATIEDLEKRENSSFDLISLAHVLEHLPDPVWYLVHLREVLLDPAGWLLLEVPNLYAHDSFEVAHLVSYSPGTLKQTLEKAGFEIVRLEQHGRPRSKMLPLYITLLGCPAPSRTFRLNPEKRVALKRRLGILRRRSLERLFPKQAWLSWK
jgi:2-polyprenyl-3-methyl-5-hydroxy-6-metoxy-1,4-benzoquinol methylase